MGPAWAGPGEIWEGGLGQEAMEAAPTPDFAMLRELLAPPYLNSEPPPEPPIQQTPRAPGCLRPSGRCVHEQPFPPPGPVVNGSSSLVPGVTQGSKC